MKVALLQTNPTVGALRANADALLDLAARAEAAGASLAVGPELGLTGYPPRDLLDRPAFLAEVARETERLVGRTPAGIALAFGTVTENASTPGLFCNAAVVARGGARIATAEKQLLPTYDVFDEARYFAPGSATTHVRIADQRVALTVCEDAWGEAIGRYRENPLDAVGPDTTDLLVNLSASPFTLSKLDFRPRLFAEVARRHRVAVVLVNQVGGNDELVFDGRSSVWDARGQLVARARMFEEDFLVVDLGGRGSIAPEATERAEAAQGALVLGIRDYARKTGFSRAVLGLSGGIDSAVTGALAADALGPDRVLGVSMPTRYSSRGSLDDAASLARRLGIEHRVIDVDPLFSAVLEHLRPAVDGAGPPGPGDVTWENAQARLRGAVIMALSNRTGALVLTTGNKSEIAVGYCTLYGDMVGGLAALCDVPKTLVYDIARFINRNGERIPVASIDKPPSAELRPDQKDEDSLPPYSVLDPILELHVEQGLSAEQIIRSGFDREVVVRVVGLVRRAEYKRRQAAPGLIITGKAFGPGRRMPIAQAFKEDDGV